MERQGEITSYNLLYVERYDYIKKKSVIMKHIIFYKFLNITYLTEYKDRVYGY